MPNVSVSGEGIEMELEISDDPYHVWKLNTSLCPVCVTLYQVCYTPLFMLHYLVVGTCYNARLQMIVGNDPSMWLEITKWLFRVPYK